MQVQDALLYQQIQDRKKIAKELGVEIEASKKASDYERARNALAQGLLNKERDTAKAIWEQARGIGDANSKLQTQLQRVQDINWQVRQIPRSVTVNVINKTRNIPVAE